MMELISGCCMGFFDESSKDCNKCRESEVCMKIKNSEELSKEIGKIKKNDRKNINNILREVKGGQLF